MNATTSTTVTTQVAEVAIVGAGPAGLAAATRLAQAGITPVVFDLNASPGGQIYRQVEAPQAGARITGADYRRGRRLVEAFRQAEIDYRPDSRVWWVQRSDTGFSLGVLRDGVSRTWQVRYLMLCHGAMERPFPFPGWQLPGVMNAGAAQILLKQGGLVPDGPPVLAGSGPLLYLLGWQYLQAGHPPACILDLTPRRQWWLPLRHPRRAWHARGYLAKGLRMMSMLKRAGIAIELDVDALEAVGKTSLEAVRYRQRGHWRERPAALLLSHAGIMPETQLTRALELPHRWNAAQRSFAPLRGETLAASDGLWIVGDAAAIGGAANAVREGTLAALALLAARRSHAAEGERESLRRARARDLQARRLLDEMFRPPLDIAALPGETLICRCENLSRDALERAIVQGARGPNQLKAFTRCGMGPCQGRQCGVNASLLLAHCLGRSPDQVGYWQVRPPLQTITLGELATPNTT